MKKGFTSVLTILVVLFMVTGCFDKDEKISNNNNNTKQLTNSTDNEQEGMRFSNIRIEKSGATSFVRGTVENKSGKEDTFKIQLVMSNKETKRVYGRAEVNIETLKVNEKRNFEVSMVGDYGSVDNFEIVILK